MSATVERKMYYIYLNRPLADSYECELFNKRVYITFERKKVRAPIHPDIIAQYLRVLASMYFGFQYSNMPDILAIDSLRYNRLCYKRDAPGLRLFIHEDGTNYALDCEYDIDPPQFQIKYHRSPTFEGVRDKLDFHTFETFFRKTLHIESLVLFKDRLYREFQSFHHVWEEYKYKCDPNEFVARFLPNEVDFLGYISIYNLVQTLEP
jgi:hypothetical protein